MAPGIMVWGLGQPGATHWRQWLNLAVPIGLKRGHNVAAMGYLLNRAVNADGTERLARPGV